jgi:hypothetical protein
MKNNDQFPTEKLVQNTISAFRNGYLGDEQAMFAVDFAAKLGDTDAQKLLDKCKEIGVAEAFNSIGK